MTPSLYLLLHQLTFYESSGFTDSFEQLIANPDSNPLRIGGVAVDYTGGEVRAVFTYNRECGAPDRGWMRKSLVLPVNVWGQLTYNGRFAEEGGWRYEKTVINVGLFEPPSEDVFTRTEPTHRYSAMGHLL